TPLWRNGPPEKPVLCNACGSRWRTKGTLAKYAPIHSRAFAPPDFGDSKQSRQDKLPPSTKSKSWYVKVHNESTTEDEQSSAEYYPCSTYFEDDSSNKSSSGSAISVSESCVQLGSTDGNEISGPFQSSFYDFQIPSRKRTRMRRHSVSPVEKLRQDLVTILQKQDSSYYSDFSEEVLLFEREDLSFSSEIGHGSVLLKPPVSSKEEESEASSHIIGNRVSCLNDPYMGVSCCSGQSHNNEVSSSQSVKAQVIQEKWNTNEGKENVVKKHVSANRSLKSTYSGDPVVLQNKYSSQICVNEKPLICKSLNSTIEVSSLASEVTGTGMIIYAKRPREVPPCEAPTITSGEEMILIQAPSSGTESLSALSQNLGSDVNNSVNTVQAEVH
ncbi:Gata transcription factor, partial [Thalictrum thalictroides]